MRQRLEATAEAGYSRSAIQGATRCCERSLRCAGTIPSAAIFRLTSNIPIIEDAGLIHKIGDGA